MREEDMKCRRQAISIQEILPQLIVRYRLSGSRSTDELSEVWQTVTGGAYSANTRVGSLRRGVLEILVTDSVYIQELTFHKQEYLKALNAAYHSGSFKDIRFKIGR